jgi:hypothetical protein
MDCFSKVTLRQVIEKMYKSGRRREALLAYPLIDLPLADAFPQRDSIMKDLIQLPSIGRGTVVDIDRAIREHAGLSEVSPAKGEGATDHAALSSPEPSASSDERGNDHGEPGVVPNEALAMTRSDTHPFWLWLQSKGHFCYYLPYTLPNILMTDAVWDVENMKDIVIRTSLPNAEEVFTALVLSKKKIEFVIDRHVWEDFSTYSGQYTKLSKRAVQEQVSVFQKLRDATGGRVSFSITGHKENGLTKCLVSEGALLSSFLFGGYYVSHSDTLIRQTLQAIHDAKPSILTSYKLDEVKLTGRSTRFVRASGQ